MDYPVPAGSVPLRVLLVEDSENGETLLLRELGRATTRSSRGSTRPRRWSGR